MKNKIKHIAKIQTGVFAKPGYVGDIVYLQSKYFTNEGELLRTLIPDILFDKISNKHILNAGDILFAAKGNKNFAACFIQKNFSAVASTSFFVIRLTVSDVLPKYLTWYLNQSHIIEFLKSKAIGTSTQSISKVALGELEIIIPSIKKQIIILEIDRLKKKEKIITEKITTLKKDLTQQKIINYLKQTK